MPDDIKRCKHDGTLTNIEKHCEEHNQTKPPVEGIDEVNHRHQKISDGGCYREQDVVQ